MYPTAPVPPRRELALRWGAGLAWFGLFAALTLIPLLAKDPARNNVWLKVFAPAAQAFAERRDLYDLGGGFRYPPIVAAALLPFTWAGDRFGSVLWRWCNLAVLLLGCRAAFRAALPFAWSPAARGAFWLVLLPTAVTSLANGQSNGLLLGLLLLATTALPRRPLGSAGAVVAATAIKVYPLVLGGVFAVLRPRVLPWLVLLLAVAAGLPFVLQEPGWVAGQYRVLWEHLRAEDRTQDLADAYRDLRLVLAAIGLPIQDTLFLALGAVAGLGIAARAFAWRRQGDDPAVRGHLLALVLCWMLLFGPATEQATYVLLGPPLAWGLVAAAHERRRAAFALHGAALALALAGLAVAQIPRATQAEHPLLRCTWPIAALLVLLPLLAARRPPAGAVARPVAG